jgi:hypothetical protein
MPSPFPGMDPYLETSAWGSLHVTMIGEIMRQLAPLLRPKYVTLAQECFYTAMPDPDEGLSIVATSPRTVYPDVGVFHGDPSGAATATAPTAAAEPLQVATVMPEKVPHASIEIRDRENRELITAIELLSPTNKRGRGRKEYLRKRSKYLLSNAHLIEIDLLGAGIRPPMHGKLPPTRYFVFVGRAWKRPICDVYAIPLHSALPTIDVPLAGRNENVPLNLQAAFTNVYEQTNLDLAVDYDRRPDTALDQAEQKWVASVLAGRPR